MSDARAMPERRDCSSQPGSSCSLPRSIREFRRRIRLLPEEKPVLATFLRLLEEVAALIRE